MTGHTCQIILETVTVFHENRERGGSYGVETEAGEYGFVLGLGENLKINYSVSRGLSDNVGDQRRDKSS